MMHGIDMPDRHVFSCFSIFTDCNYQLTWQTKQKKEAPKHRRKPRIANSQTCAHFSKPPLYMLDMDNYYSHAETCRKWSVWGWAKYPGKYR